MDRSLLPLSGMTGVTRVCTCHLWANNWSMRLFWSTSLRDWDNFNLKLSQIARVLLHTNFSLKNEYYTITECIWLVKAICGLSTPPKNDLHNWKAIWFKIVTKWAEKMFISTVQGKNALPSTVSRLKTVSRSCFPSESSANRWTKAGSFVG